MSGPTYTLKPLAFGPDEEYPSMVAAPTVFGRLFVGRLGRHWTWFLEVGSTGGNCVDQGDGIRLATAWYAQAIAPAVEAVVEDRGLPETDRPG